MTKQELNHHLALRRRLEKERALLASLEAAGLAAEAVEMRETVFRAEMELQRSETEAAAWIAAIEDDTTRMLFRLRFIRGLEWEAVAALIGGTAHSAGIRCRRYLEAHHDK